MLCFRVLVYRTAAVADAVWLSMVLLVQAASGAH